MSDQLTLAFDYAALDPVTRSTVQDATARIRTLERTTGEAIIEIGRQLIAVKESLPHGQFGTWIDSEFSWSHDTARRFMKVAVVFGENTQFASFQPSALYALVSGNVPEPIRDHFIQKAEAGESVRHSDVQGALTVAIPTPSNANVVASNSVPWLTVPEPDEQDEADDPTLPDAKTNPSAVGLPSGRNRFTVVNHDSDEGQNDPGEEPDAVAAEIFEEDHIDRQYQFQKTCLRHLKATGELTALKPQAVADLADDGLWHELDIWLPKLRTWMDDVERARPRGLRVVG